MPSIPRTQAFGYIPEEPPSSGGGPGTLPMAYGTAIEVASFDAEDGIINVVGWDDCDPPIDMTFPDPPTANMRVGLVFSPVTGPISLTAGVVLVTGSKTIQGLGPFTVPPRPVSPSLVFQFNAASDQWEPNDPSFYLAADLDESPQLMARRSALGLDRAIFPLQLSQPSSLVGRADESDVLEIPMNVAPLVGVAIAANFAVRDYMFGGLGGYDAQAFARGLNTLLPWSTQVPIAGDTTIEVNTAYRVAPPADTLVRIALPNPATLIGGEQVMLVQDSEVSSGVFVLNAGAATFTIPGLGNISDPLFLNSRYAPNALNPLVLLQYNAQQGAWDAIVSGFDPLRREAQSYKAALAGGVGVVTDVPGPAAGFVRVFDFVQVTADLIAAPLAAVKSDIVVLAGPTVYPVISGIAGTSSLNLSCYVLAEGEVLRVTNGGVNAGRLSATYFDVPSHFLTPIRVKITGPGSTVIIPEPPAGFYRRIYQAPLMSLQTRNNTGRFNLYNDDTVAHQVSAFMGATLLGRNAAVAAAAVGSFPANAQQPVVAGGGAYGMATQVAITTRQLSITGAYETLPLTTF